jgi:hypothetical protein
MNPGPCPLFARGCDRTLLYNSWEVVRFYNQTCAYYVRKITGHRRCCLKAFTSKSDAWINPF